MPLDPKVQALLVAAQALNRPPLSQQTVSEARQGLASDMAAIHAQTPPIAVVQERSIPGAAGEIPVRIYTPFGAEPFPLLVFLHGGGWVIGDLDTHDHVCRYLCARASCVVLSVGYRLAPEHPFPAGSDDCLAAVRWGAAHAQELQADAQRIVVGGDSAGGNLSAVTALRLRDAGDPLLRGQLLIYPVTAHYSAGFPSYEAKGYDYGLTKDAMIWFWDRYLQQSGAEKNPYAAPLEAADLCSLPPSFLCVAEYDPLHDEGVAYAQRLEAAEIPLTFVSYPGVNHGFVNMLGVVDQAQEALDAMADWLRAIFA